MVLSRKADDYQPERNPVFSDAVCNPGGQRTGSVARRYEACGKNTDQVSRRQTEEIKSLPLRLIGCSRKEVEDEIRHYQDAPPLTELQQGLLRMELVSFSPQQIVVSKTYRKLQQAEAFFYKLKRIGSSYTKRTAGFYICRPRLTQEPCQAGSDGRF